MRLSPKPGRRAQRLKDAPSACLDAGVALRYRTYEHDDPAGFVVSLNLKRRHLSESRRTMVASRLATLGKGGYRRSDDFKASIDALKQSEAGAASVSAAAEVASLPEAAQAEIVACGELEITRAVKRIREEKAAANREKRAAQKAHLAALFLPDGNFEKSRTSVAFFWPRSDQCWVLS